MAPLQAEFVVMAEAKRGLLSYDKRMFQRLAAQLKDGEYELFVQRFRATRSLQANRYYFGVVLSALADHTGYTPDELHELMKMKFLPKHLALTDGNGDIKGEFVMGGSTRKLKVSEFFEFVEQVRRFAAEELNVYTPDPGEA